MVDLAFLDLDSEGRIISHDALAKRFLDMKPHYIRKNGARFFTPDPSHTFLRALLAACDDVNPVSTVFNPSEDTHDPFLQINVLPFQPGLARVVLFWAHSDTEISETEDPAPSVSVLSARERDVLELAAEGLRRDRIAYKLNISLPTVDMHARNLRRKLSALTTSEAVAIAVKMKLL